MGLLPTGSTRDKAIFVGGGVAWWAAQNPIKRMKFAYRASNFIRFGTAGSSIGLGTSLLYGGAVLVGWSAGSMVLLTGTYTAEHFGFAPEGSTEHAIDFVSGDVSSPLDYLPIYNMAKIVKHHI